MGHTGSLQCHRCVPWDGTGVCDGGQGHGVTWLQGDGDGNTGTWGDGGDVG